MIKTRQNNMTNANQEPTLLLKNAVVCISAGGRQAKSLELPQVVALFVWNWLCQMNAYCREYIDTLRSQKEGRWGTPILKGSILGKWQTQQAETMRCQGTGSRPASSQQEEEVWVTQSRAAKGLFECCTVSPRCQVDYRYSWLQEYFKIVWVI